MPLEFDNESQNNTVIPCSGAMGLGQTVASETDDEAQTEVKQLCADLDLYMARQNKSFVWYSYSALMSTALTLIASIPLQFMTRAARHDPTYMHRHGPFILTTVLVFSTGAMAGFLIPAVVILLSSRSRDARRKLDRLKAHTAMTASTTLVRLLGMYDSKVRQSAEQGLMEIVPFWSEMEFTALTLEERTRIRRSIVGFNAAGRGFPPPRPVYPVSPDLCVALCRKVAWFGNQEDLAVLKRVARYPALNSGRRRVQQAAREAVPTLEARLAEQNRPHTLLRASATPDAQPGELLRAASATSAAPEDELLRPEG